MIFKGVRDGKPYPEHSLAHRDWAKIPPQQVRLDEPLQLNADRKPPCVHRPLSRERSQRANRWGFGEEGERAATHGRHRPCSSGRRSEGLQWWKAPEQMKRMWSVLMLPYLPVPHPTIAHR